MRITAAVVLVGVLPLCSVRAQATREPAREAAPTGRIVGRVALPVSAVAIEGATITLRREGDTLVTQTVTSDATGEFVLPALAPGKYVVAAAHPSLDSSRVARRTSAVRLLAGRSAHVYLGHSRPVMPTTSACGESQPDHPALYQWGGAGFTVGNGAALLQRLPPDEPGLKAQYVLTDYCRPVPLSERAHPPLQ